MRRPLAWLAGALGLAGAFRALKRQPEAVPEAADPRADELRRRIEEAKPLADERERFEAGETPVDEAEPAAPGAEPEEPTAPLDESDPDARRRGVHERARSAIDEMRRAGDEPDEP